MHPVSLHLLLALVLLLTQSWERGGSVEAIRADIVADATLLSGWSESHNFIPISADGEYMVSGSSDATTGQGLACIAALSNREVSPYVSRTIQCLKFPRSATNLSRFGSSVVINQLWTPPPDPILPLSEALLKGASSI